MKRFGWLLLSICLLGCRAGGSETGTDVFRTEEPPRSEAIVLLVQPTEEAHGATTLSSVPTAPPTPEPAFFDKFVSGEPVLTETSYQSETTAVFLSRVEDTSHTFDRGNLVYRVADIYLKDPTLLRAAFTHENFAYKYIKPMKEVAEGAGAILAISGDYIRHRESGICVRNGETYRTEHDPERDVCVFYRDGTMETFDADNVPEETLLSDPNVWHIIGFGPALLDENGRPKESFHTRVGGHNPRAVIGYYEPGHYCFVLVEGRQSDSSGIRMTGLSALMASLGCKRAFNLDGGNTAAIYFDGRIINTEADRPRDVHDIFYIPKG